MSRYAILVEYLGKRYFGYQEQKELPTIQEKLEEALKKLNDGVAVKVLSSGRTDAGVSAKGQVCHFDIDKEYEEYKFIRAINFYLPDDISVKRAVKVSDDFYSSTSVVSKTYSYGFYLSNVRNPLYNHAFYRLNEEINVDLMKESLEHFKGKHDFSSFVSVGSSKKSNIREIIDISLVKVDEKSYKLMITGNGFLYNMVRIIAGVIVSAGYKEINLKDIDEIIAKKDRKYAKKTLPPYPLCLEMVDYGYNLFPGVVSNKIS